MRDSGLIQELLLRVGAERHTAIVEALLLDVEIGGVVVDILFGTVWRDIGPLGSVSTFSLLHLLFSSIVVLW